jgi:hypothetical protein
VHDHRGAEEVGGEAPHDVHRIVVGADLDVPRCRPAGTRETRYPVLQAKDEDLRLDRALGAPGGLGQAGRALWRICSLVAVMLWTRLA